MKMLRHLSLFYILSLYLINFVVAENLLNEAEDHEINLLPEEYQTMVQNYKGIAELKNVKVVSLKDDFIQFGFDLNLSDQLINFEIEKVKTKINSARKILFLKSEYENFILGTVLEKENRIKKIEIITSLITVYLTYLDSDLYLYFEKKE